MDRLHNIGLFVLGGFFAFIAIFLSVVFAYIVIELHDLLGDMLFTFVFVWTVLTVGFWRFLAGGATSASPRWEDRK